MSEKISPDQEELKKVYDEVKYLRSVSHKMGKGQLERALKRLKDLQAQFHQKDQAKQGTLF